MEEGHLHLFTALLCALEEDLAAIAKAPECTLNESAAPLNFFIVPLDLEHSPILLDVNSRLSLLVSPLLGLASIFSLYLSYLTA